LHQSPPKILDTSHTSVTHCWNVILYTI